MKPECIAAVTTAAGKALTPAKLKAIEDALEGKMRELARRDRVAWLAKGRDQQMVEAAIAASDDIRTAAKLKEYRGQLQVLAVAQTQERTARNMATNGGTMSQGYARDLVQTGLHIEAVRDAAISTMADMIKAAESTEGTSVLRNLGMRMFAIDNPQMTAAVVREVFKNADGHTGNKAAQAGARAWLDTAEALRQRFNAAGGDVGKLGYGYLAQTHDSRLVWKAGAEPWASKVLPLLDREQYVNADGTLMNDGQMMEMLRAAHRTISEEGDNKVAAGQFRGTGATAKHGSEARVLHFRDGDAWLDYMGEFGRGSLYDAMIGHIGAMARDIGLVERMGPNATQTNRLMVDLSERADRHGGFTDKRSFGGRPDNYFRILTGEAGVPDSEGLAALFREARAAEVAAKLGGTLWTAVGGDLGTVLATLHYNRLPYLEMLKNLGRLRGDEMRDTLVAHGVISDTLTRGLDRFVGEHLAATGPFSMLANGTMRMTWVNAWTGMLHEATQVTVAGGIARAARKAWADLDQWDQYLFAKAGFTPDDWAVLQQVQPTPDFGGAHITPAVVRESGIDGAQAVADKVSAFMKDESHFAAVTPDLDTRSVVTVGGLLRPGTPSGEILRSVAQFQTFPVAMISRHLRRIWDTPQGLEGAPAGFGGTYGAPVNRLAATAAFTVSLALAASIALQIKQLLQGKDPLDMTEPKFWGRAVAMGGGLSYLGDFLTRDPVDQRTFGFERYFGLAGPLAGSAGGLVDLTFGNAYDLAKGRNPNAAGEALGFANRHMPLVNMWQVKPMWDHWFLYYAQENLNPGYLGRMQRRAMKDWGQGWYWAPGDALPERAPDFGAAVGQ